MNSSKTLTNHIILIIAVVLIMSTAASALTEEFTASTTKEALDVCACDFYSDYITIQNTGEITSTFLVTSGGEAQDFVSIAPRTFFLEQGEVKSVERFIQLPCSARGEYSLNTSIKTLFDYEKTIYQTLNVENCANVEIIPKFSGSQQECPCTPVEYSFDVVNTGDHTETYAISIEPFSEAISLSTDFLVLDPGQKEQVTAFINLPCGEYGTKEFTFNALARGTGILGQTEFTLDINKCYDYDLVIGDEYEVCEGVTNVLPFTIQNNAEITNQYFLTLEGEEWAYIEDGELEALGGETVGTNLVLHPPIAQEDKYSYLLTSTSTQGEEVRDADIELTVNNCNDYELLETEDVFMATECQEKNHNFVLKNTGSRQSTYYIDLVGFDWITTYQGPIVLGPEEEANVILSGPTPCESAGEYLENIYVTIEETNQTYVEEKKFTIYSVEDTYMPEITISDLSVDYTGGEAEINIKNTGFDTARYDFTLEASDWITTDPVSVTLAPGEESVVLLQAYPYEDVIPDTYAGVLVASVADAGVEYAADFQVKVAEHKGLGLWLWILIGSSILLVLVIIIVLIVLLSKGKKDEESGDEEDDKKEKKAISIKKKAYSKKRADYDEGGKTWPIILMLAIIALLAIGAVAFFIYTGNGILSFSNETNETDFTEKIIPEEIAKEPVLEAEPAVDEPAEPELVTEEDISESLITIDRSSVAGKGNVLKVTDEERLNLPLTVRNPTDRNARFTLTASDEGWVEFEDNKISLGPESSTTLNVSIFPDPEALAENDYTVSIQANLEGSKIEYAEEMEFVISENRPFLQNYWPWLLIGLLVALIAVIIVALFTRDKKPEKPAKKNKKSAVVKKPKKVKKKTARKDEGPGVWLPILIGVIILVFIIAGGFFAYYTLYDGSSVEGEEIVDESGEPSSIEEIVEPETPVEPSQLTEENIPESLITIDRSSVSGKGNVLELDNSEEHIPLTITNPTDRKAIFTISTQNDSWITFDTYNVVVEPNTAQQIDMIITPDMESLEDNEYAVSVNANLFGSKIDYEEQLDFILREKKLFDMSWLAYALIGIVLLGVAVLIAELVRRSGKDDAGAAKKPKKATASKGKKSKSDKKTTKKDKDVDEINKDLAALRKKTAMKLKKAGK